VLTLQHTTQASSLLRVEKIRVRKQTHVLIALLRHSMVFRKSQVITRGEITHQGSSSAPAMNPSRLGVEQIESAENAARRRNAPRRNAPIPEEDDSTGTEDETALLFADKLLPSDKLKIKRLKKDIFRIRQGTQTQDYLWKRDKAIKAAEAERLAGGLGPVYLAELKFPWKSDEGQAPREYDEDQIDAIKEQIEKIIDNNAALCQLEYTATKGEPGVKEIVKYNC
jgi:hypothetical protein